MSKSQLNNRNAGNLCCPSCNREFEVPRRYRIKEDDYDYAPIPRIMGCLHTVCHSCLEDQRERNSEGKVTCPICKEVEVVKGVQFMPLDISAMKQAVQLNSTESMSVCARCYESVPSFSWCDTCSSALCEFHHQDHILSVDTSKNHRIHTFKEIKHKGLQIDYKFAPIACPEVLLQDCSIYCHDCLHLVSSQGMVENHKDHNVDDFKELISDAEKTVHDAQEQAQSNCSQMQHYIDITQDLLQELDENESSSLAEISRVFNMLQRKLKHREEELVQRLKGVVQQKRSMLTEQLTLLSEGFEENSFAAELAASIDRSTQESDNEKMYLLAASESIEFRTDTLTERMAEKVATLVQVDPAVSVHFVPEEAHTFKALTKSFGGISYTDDSTGLKTGAIGVMKAADEAVAERKQQMQPGDEDDAEADDTATPLKEFHRNGDKRDSGRPAVRFCVQIKREHLGKAAKGKHLPTNSQYLVVEARMVDEDDGATTTNNTSAGGTAPLKKGISRLHPESVVAMNPAAGRLLGSVVLHTNIDRRLLHRHELRSYFESLEEDGLPVMKIIKEIVPTT